MTALVTLSCDRMRGGQPCRGALHSRHRNALGARHEAREHGWSSTIVDLPEGGHAYVDTCPSPGHDEP